MLRWWNRRFGLASTMKSAISNRSYDGIGDFKSDLRWNRRFQNRCYDGIADFKIGATMESPISKWRCGGVYLWREWSDLVFSPTIPSEGSVFNPLGESSNYWEGDNYWKNYGIVGIFYGNLFHHFWSILFLFCSLFLFSICFRHYYFVYLNLSDPISSGV